VRAGVRVRVGVRVKVRVGARARVRPMSAPVLLSSSTPELPLSPCSMRSSTCYI